jgi:hypothetical protein
MSHFEFPPNFVVPERPWPYTHRDVAEIARSAGLTGTEDIDNEIRGYAVAEWVLVLRLARIQNAALSLSDEQWSNVIEALRVRHREHWSVFAFDE